MKKRKLCDSPLSLGKQGLRDIKVDRLPKWYEERRAWTSGAVKEALKTLWPKYGRSEQSKTLQFGVSVDLDDWFAGCGAADGSAITFEIGFGTGDALLELAKRKPDERFLGCEIYKVGQGHMARRLHELGINNVRLVGGDGRKFLVRQCPDLAFRQVNIFFPDPFPNSEGLRIFNDEFVSLLSSKTQAGEKSSVPCQINFASDVSDYCLSVIKTMDRTGKSLGWNLKQLFRSAGPIDDTPLKQREQEASASEEILTIAVSLFPDVKVEMRRIDWRPETQYERIAKKEGRFVWDFVFESVCSTNKNDLAHSILA